MILNLDCRHGLATLPSNSVDAVITDPPYEIGFMDNGWDRSGIAYSVQLWQEVLRILKPGGHLLAFGGSRTYHRLTCAIEDAGFDIRDCIMWVYGQGYPKSANVGNGWGTGLKPAHEPICVARKKLIGKTVTQNMQMVGVGGLNIEACRIPIDAEIDASQLRTMNTSQHDGGDGWGMGTSGPREDVRVLGNEGRWPSNFIHDGELQFPNGEGRFFYCAKASRRDREEGLELMAKQVAGVGALRDGERTASPRANAHPTVKPTDLMRYLCKLVTPFGGLIVDPFAGSGSTGKAAVIECYQFLGFELDPNFAQIANTRVDAARWKYAR